MTHWCCEDDPCPETQDRIKNSEFRTGLLTMSIVGGVLILWLGIYLAAIRGNGIEHRVSTNNLSVWDFVMHPYTYFGLSGLFIVAVVTLSSLAYTSEELKEETVTTTPTTN